MEDQPRVEGEAGESLGKNAACAVRQTAWDEPGAEFKLQDSLKRKAIREADEAALQRAKRDQLRSGMEEDEREPSWLRCEP